MGIIKKIIALGLVAGSTVFGALVLYQNKNGNEVAALPKVEKPAHESLPIISNIPGGGSFVENTTQQVAEKFAEELGPLAKVEDLEDIDADKLFDRVFQESLSVFDPKSLIPQLRVQDIKTSANYDKASRETYFKNLSTITQVEVTKLKRASFDSRSESFSAAAAAYERIVANLYNLVVPEPLVNFHKEAIKTFGLQKNIFDNLANYETDPLRAMAVLPILEESTKQLATLWSQYAK